MHTTSENTNTVSASRLYVTVWRWHFYAGLFVMPIIVLLAVTGALYTFDEEIERWWYAELMTVSVCQSAPAGVDRQEARVLEAYPGASIRRFAAPTGAGDAAAWSITTPRGEALTVFVNPCDAALLGALTTDQRLMNLVRDLHGELLLGRWGSYLVELTACWGFVLLVSGLYLWWPRRPSHGIFGALLPRLGARGRVFLRDLHSVPAFWNAVFLAFLILTGLPWAGFSGDQLARLGTVSPLAASTPHFRGAVVPQSAGFSETPAPARHHDEHHDEEEDRETPWTIRHAPVPSSGQGVKTIDIATVMQIAQRHRDTAGLGIKYPVTPSEVFTLSWVPDRAQDQRTLYLDQYTGAVLGDIDWSDYSPVGKAVEFGVMTHMGRQFGVLNQWVCFLTCVLTVLTAVTGAVMWWKRRPAGRLGAPKRQVDVQIPAGVLALIGGLGILFPLVGTSILVMLLVDWGLAMVSRFVRRSPLSSHGRISDGPSGVERRSPERLL